MGTFSKGVQELNVTGYHTITNSGTPGSVFDDIYENTSINDLVLFQPLALTVAGSTISVNQLDLVLDQKNFETGTYANVFSIATGLTGSKPVGLHTLAMTPANIRTLERFGRFYNTNFNQTYDGITVGAVTFAPPPIILWPGERIRTQANIPAASGNVNFQWAAHIIRNPGS